MNEYTTVWQSFAALIGLSVACLLYSLGGRSKKWIRRICGACVLSMTVNGLLFWRGMWNPWFLLILPSLVTGFSLGYGADQFWFKVIRRTVYAIGVLASGLIMAVILGGNAWWMFVPHVGVGLWSIWLGVKNPIDAPAEEALVCAALNLCLVFYPFIGR
jgi:hypothetical protein